MDEKDKHGHYELPRSLNQEKLSKILGTTRVTVNKKIKELRQKEFFSRRKEI
ncbi:helix-turn-helix domain-containing protein [Ligilactobacillus salivarius]